MDKDEFKNAFGIEKNEDFIEYISKNILKFFNIGEKEFMKKILKLMQNKCKRIVILLIIDKFNRIKWSIN